MLTMPQSAPTGRLAGKIAVIVGGSGGIGRETHAILPGDPLSARMTTHWTEELERDDGPWAGWRVRTDEVARAAPRLLRERRPDCRIVVLTGYGAIATAVAAVKIGATDYLSKPADANDVTNALLQKGEAMPAPPENPMSADRVRWEHIQRVYEMCDRNVSETARRLNMHRRTLQRILAKRSPR